MVWNESAEQPFHVPDSVVDLRFKIDCPQLPVDHAYALSKAVSQVLPWIMHDHRVGVHLIHGAETGNGWQRPGDANGDLLQLSKRTRFTLRLPRERLRAANALSGKVLQVGDYPMRIGAATVRALSPLTTLFARHVVAQAQGTESAFTDDSLARCRAMGINIPKMLCGRLHQFVTPDQIISVRSLLLAEMSIEHSVLLQQQGLGEHRAFGCGIFLPSKSIQAVHESRTQETDTTSQQPRG